MCCAHTVRASSQWRRGARRRWQTCSISAMPRSSWRMWRGHSASGVTPLPRSCTSTAKRTSVSLLSAAACCRHSNMCSPVSISGWWAAGCGTPKSAFTSGSSWASAPQSRSTCMNTSGWRSPSALSSSTQTRSGGRWANSPCSTMSAIRASVCGATVKFRWA